MYQNCLNHTEDIVKLLNEIETGNSEARSFFPELAGMLEISSEQHSILRIEHSNDGANPVWEHLKRVICCKLYGLEKHEISLFQSDDALDAEHFERLAGYYDQISELDDLPVILRASLLFSDISKGMGMRSQWHIPDIDYHVHNEASAKIVESTQLLDRLNGLGKNTKKLIIGLISLHGFIGQYVRGEITWHCFKPLCELIVGSVSSKDNIHQIKALIHVYLLMNVIDTAGVREGLLTNDRLEQFEQCANSILHDCLSDDIKDTNRKNSKSERMEHLVERLSHLRSGRQQLGESPDVIRDAIESFDDSFFEWFDAHLGVCQLWYCEAATGTLSVMSQVKLIAIGIREWMDSNDYEPNKLFSLDLSPIAALLSPHTHKGSPEAAKSRANYRRRLLETILDEESLSLIMSGDSRLYKSDFMLAMKGMKGAFHSISLDIKESEEAEALITLLSIYERKSSVAYHSALKLLCDLYHLRKDDFDRLSNEEQYLLTMNAAKSDKERMLRYLHSGKIVEVGPGGGVVLDLLEQRFTDSEIFGLDLSHQVILALEQKKAKQHANWQVIEGNAFELPKLFTENSLDAVIFCSILHEIYSYVEREDGTRFHLESVRDMLQAAFRTLKSGGRILIRDGIMPEHEPRQLQFKCDDARSFFEAFCREFKGRNIVPNYIDRDTVALDSADAMEFMYTYTWGPEAFPYEVREQYGIMTYADYCNNIKTWLGPTAQIVSVLPEEASYLQPGYVQALKDKLKLMDKDGNEVPYPASNAIIVIEKV